MESRVHYEGSRKRGIVTCEQVYENDVELRLEGSGLVLRGTEHYRNAAEAARCTP